MNNTRPLFSEVGLSEAFDSSGCAFVSSFLLFYILSHKSYFCASLSYSPPSIEPLAASMSPSYENRALVRVDEEKPLQEDDSPSTMDLSLLRASNLTSTCAKDPCFLSLSSKRK